MRIKKAIILIILTILIMPLFVVKYAFSSLNIPIIVQEALPAGVSGIDRDNEPLTVGIPLMDSDNIKDISQLGLSGVSIGQFRVLRRYPSGNIQWVLVDTQVSVPANGTTTIYLTNGTGNFGGPNLAEDKADYIVVNTGPAQFVIRKKNFNFIDQVIINGVEMVHSAHDGGLVVEGAKIDPRENDISNLVEDNLVYNLYYSKYDANSTAIIEENGPVKCVIKATGQFKDEKGDGFIRYTVRFYFYKNKTYFKAVVSLRNACPDLYYPQYINWFRIKLPVDITGQLSFEFARKSDVVTGQLEPGENAYMYQAYSNGPFPLSEQWKDTDAWKPPIKRISATEFIQQGLEIKHGDTFLSRLGDPNDWSQGWGEIKNQDGAGVTIAIRYMSALWPLDIEFDGNGNTYVGLLSKYNSTKNLKMRYGSYDTRELIYDFHLTQINNKKVLYNLQYPLLGRAPFEQYVKTGAFFGEEKLISFDKEKEWFGKFGKEFNEPGNSEVRICRAWWRSTTGELNNYDKAALNLLWWLRKGYAGQYLWAEQRVRFNVDTAVYRGDDDCPDVKPPSINLWTPNQGSYNGYSYYDIAHSHWLDLIMYYYLTGDERVKEAIMDFTQSLPKPGSWLMESGLDYSDMRVCGRTLRNLALAYEFTRDETIKNSLKYFIKKILKSRAVENELIPGGRDLNRGFMWIRAISSASNPTFGSKRHTHCFFLTTIFSNAVYHAMRVLPDGDPIKEDLQDFLLGLGYFIYMENYGERNGGTEVTDFGYPYFYLLDEPNDFATTAYGDWWILEPSQSSRVLAHAYEMTGDIKFLERGEKLLFGLFDYGSQYYRSTQFQTLHFMYDDLYRNVHVGYINPVGNGEVTLKSENVVKNPDGTYTLTWTVPVDGIIRYQIKFSDQRLVENLNFNQYDEPRVINGVEVPPRSYQFDPNKYDNFWAALNIDNEPEPGKKGEVQSITINVEKVINDYNERYGLTEEDPAYIKYDPNKTYYFAIKYWTAGELPLIIATYNSLPSGIVGRSYSHSIQACGGNGNYSFSLISGTLPPGLSLSKDGVISGTPSKQGTYTFIIQVSDREGHIASKEFSLNISALDSNNKEIIIAGGVQKDDNQPKSGCFIATAAYGTPMAKEIKYLCKFRDQYLLPNKYGKKFVLFYYRYSPPIANYIAKHETLRAIVRFFLRPLVWLSKELTTDKSTDGN